MLFLLLEGFFYVWIPDQPVFIFQLNPEGLMNTNENKQYVSKKEKAMCCKWADTKSMTKNKTEGEAAGGLTQWMEQLQLTGQVGYILSAISLGAADALVSGHVLHLAKIVYS